MAVGSKLQHIVTCTTCSTVCKTQHTGDNVFFLVGFWERLTVVTVHVVGGCSEPTAFSAREL